MAALGSRLPPPDPTAGAPVPPPPLPPTVPPPRPGTALLAVGELPELLAAPPEPTEPALPELTLPPPALPVAALAPSVLPLTVELGACSLVAGEGLELVFCWLVVV